MSDDPIERIRAHVEKHKHKQLAYFSIAGVRELLRQRDELKQQVDRLVTARSQVLAEALRRQGRNEPPTEQQETGK